MTENGYVTLQEPDGTWTVIDVFKKQPVEVNKVPQTGLTYEEAHKRLEALIRDDVEKHTGVVD